MSHFMVIMPGRGLERQAAGVERDALAHQGDRAAATGLRAVAQLDEARRLLGAAVHAQQPAEAQLGDLLRSSTLTSNRRPWPPSCGPPGEPARA